MGELRIAGHLIWAKIRSEAQYPASLIAHLIAQVLVLGLDLLAIWALFLRVHALGGWTRGQVLGLYAISGTAFGIGDLFVSAVERTAEHVRLGTFDRFLLRPAGTLIQLLANEFELRRLGRLIQPVVVLVLVLTSVAVDWTPAHIALCAAMIVGATTMYSAIWVSTAALAFWIPSTQEFANAFTYGGQYASQYPISIMGEWMRRILLTAIPLGLVAYVPGIELFGAANPMGIARWMSFVAPFAGVPVALAAGLLWRAGTRHYRSTGS